MSPHLGQGANLALMDAEYLARALATTNDYYAAFEQYRRERRRYIRYYAWLSKLLTPFFQSHNRILAFGRDLALPLMCRMPPVHHQMILSAAGLKRNLFDFGLRLASSSETKQFEN